MKIHIIDGVYHEVIMLQSIRIGWKGLSDYPSNTQERLKGVAVGLFVRHPQLNLEAKAADSTRSPTCP